MKPLCCRMRLLAFSVWAALVAACGNEPVSDSSDSDKDWNVIYTEEREPCSNRSPWRNLYFGDLHSHSALSFDAWLWDTNTGPEDAYAFARGAPVRLPPLDPEGIGTRVIEIDRTLDFAAVTDHAEFLAEVAACVSPESPVYDTFSCWLFRLKTDLSYIFIGLALTSPSPSRLADICGPGGVDCAEVAAQVWQRVQQAAESAYDRSASCSFTAFVAYEYTGSTAGSTLHRNILFRNDRVPALPVSYLEEPTPEGLWTQLEHSCQGTGSRCEAISVPHNSNMSNGNMFSPGLGAPLPIDEQQLQAALRGRMEPLVEIFQHKGDSECMNGLSDPAGDPDPGCAFEKLHEPPIMDCKDGTGSLGGSGRGCVSRHDFVRNVLLAGLDEEARLGVNPYRLGFIADTDTHNASPGAVAEDRYMGHLANLEDTVEERLGGFSLTPTGIRLNPGGLTAVWAVENSRDAIFEAFLRRETYGSSGPRIALRFFGGWQFPGSMCGDPDFAGIGYRRGVPMGGELPPAPDLAAAPQFAVLAERDPGTDERPGNLLQRIQIVKGWIDAAGQAREKVFEAAGDPGNGAEADPETCETRGPGFETLCVVWTDPEFKPEEPAFYYARVLENPSCRWSTYECNRLSPGERPPACSDPTIAKTVQERAWASPIWYRPGPF